MDRRSFLIAMGGSAGALAVPLQARAASTVWHVLYPGAYSRGEAREHLEQIAGVLGPGVAKNLQVARQGDAYVVIYDRSTVRNPGERSIAVEVAQRHDALLRQVVDDDAVLATVVSGVELEDTWNIRYGNPGTVAQVKPTWNTVARMLGAGVSKALVIEALDDGTHQLVYKRMADRSGTERVAEHHDQLLRSTGVRARAVREQFRVVEFDGSSAEAGAPLTAAKAPAKPVEAQVDEPEAAAQRDTGDGGTQIRATSATELSAAINAHVQELRRSGQVDRIERTSWVVHDLLADQTLCAINGDQPMQAASMIKPFVALAFFHRVQQGKLVYGPRSTSHMERMIRDSSNTSTNWLMQEVGGPAAVHAMLHKSYGAIVDELKIVEYIPGGGRTYLNKASALDHARLLRAIWRNDIPYAKELRRVMNLPGADRLYSDVPQIPVGTEVYNKTGTTAMCCGDMGILVARARDGRRVPYIVVGIIERADRANSYGAWMRVRGDVIRSVSGLTYTHLRQAYDLV